MPRVKQAVKEFLAEVPAQDRVTLLGFNDNIFTLTRKATDPAERLKAVDRLAPWGSTALYDVLLRVWPSPVVALNRAVVLAETDGPETALATLDAIDGLATYRYRWSTRADLLRRLGRVGRHLIPEIDMAIVAGESRP